MSTRLPFCFALMLAAAPLAAEPWHLDPVHTQIRFSVDHLGFSHSMGLISIKQGKLDFDAADITRSSVDVRIDLASLWMGDAKWQDTVKSWQFLQTKKWAEARYVSRAVEKTGAGEGVIHGDLTLHGKTLPLDLAFRLNKVGNDPYSFKNTAGFAATATLQRSAFGMDKLLSAVGDEVQLDIAVEAQRGDLKGGDAPLPASKDDNDDGVAQ